MQRGKDGQWLIRLTDYRTREKVDHIVSEQEALDYGSISIEEAVLAMHSSPQAFRLLCVHGLADENGDGVVPLADVPGVPNALLAAGSAGSTVCELKLLPGVRSPLSRRLRSVSLTRCAGGSQLP